MLGAAIDRETRCIQDVILDAVVDEHPVQPEPVVACLIAAYRPHPADALVPLFHGDLTCDQQRSFIVAIIGDFEEISALLGGERLGSPVVESR